MRNLAERSVTALSWNVAANLVSTAILFGRSILLAKWLPVATFGVYAGANAILSITIVLAGLGMEGAFIHHTVHTVDEDSAAAAYFTLKLLFLTIWAALVGVGAWFSTSGQNLIAMWVLIGTMMALQLAGVAQVILVRRVVYRRLALVRILDAGLTTAAAVALAWLGQTIWALLATDIVSALLLVSAMYLWRPVWRPRLTWSWPVISYFLAFGSRNVWTVLLTQALDRIDDLWIRSFLGTTALGYYSRAYTFATYPRKILVAPLSSVASGTYAELKNDQLHLSQAFFRTNALLVRSGFLFAGLLALVAPEFIRLLLGEKWLPMLTTFRFMLIFTLLDPIKATMSSLFVAVGKPEKLAWTNTLQCIVLVVGLFILGPWLGITGVALAVNGMLVVGIVLLLRQSQQFVNFSTLRLFATPTLALGVGLVAARLAIMLPSIMGSDWRTGAVKVLIFCLVYGLLLLIIERRQFDKIVLKLVMRRVFGPDQ